jgi:hypothetical protein
MRLLLLLLCFLTGCASNAQRVEPRIPLDQDYAEVSYFNIEKLGVTTPVVHLYIETKPSGERRFTLYEKLHKPAADGSYLHVQAGFRGYGSLCATFSGDAARRLLAACNSADARKEAEEYNLIGYNSNRWVVKRLEQAGLRDQVDLPWGAIQ